MVPARALEKLGILEKLSNGAPPRRPEELAPGERRILDALVAGYDAEIAYMDEHLGRLLRAIEASPRARETLVIVTADHGESFGEHYFLSHGAHLYEHNVRVPLLVQKPGQTQGRRVAEPVQNHRVFASVLAAAGLDLPEHADVRALDEDAEDVVLQVQRSESNIRLFGEFFARDLRAIFAWPYKLIVSSRDEPELYHLERDPEELDDLFATEPERARQLSAALEAVEGRRPALFTAEDRAELRPETAEALKKLGYLD